MAAEESDFVLEHREAIRALLREIAFGAATPAEKVSKRTEIVNLLAGIVFQTTDEKQWALAEKQLALAKEQLYYAHLALWGMAGITETQRRASENFISRYNRDRDAEIRAPQQPPAEQQPRKHSKPQQQRKKQQHASSPRHSRQLRRRLVRTAPPRRPLDTIPEENTSSGSS